MKKFPKLKNPLILAPMAEITNLDFRKMCKKLGASLTFTEMISVNALINGGAKVKELIKTEDSEKPIGIQLFGHDTELIIKAAKMVENDFDVIDFNLGCPAQKIMSEGAGAALLRRKNKIKEILTALVKNSKKPITAKIRIGFTNKNIIALDIAKICEESGISAITVHGRTVAQGYSGKADWDVIKEVKKNISIPVIGNGDINTIYDVKDKLQIVDYVMIGREAIKNPFIFKQAEHFLETGKVIEQSPKEKLKLFLDYSENCNDLNNLKMIAQYFTKGFINSAQLRNKLSNASDKESIQNALKEFYKRL